MESDTPTMLTLLILVSTKVHEVPKFRSQNKKVIIEIISYERRNYESVDEKSLSYAMENNSGSKGLKIDENRVNE